MTKPLRALIVEDNPDDVELLEMELRRGGYDATTEHVKTLETLRARMADGWDVIYADFQLQGFNALDVLALVREQLHSEVPIIVISGSVGEDVAVQTMQRGANDYFRKDHLERLVAATERSIRESENRRRANELERDLSAMANAAPLAIAMIERQTGRIRFRNAEYMRLFGKDTRLFTMADLDEVALRGGPVKRDERAVTVGDAQRVMTVIFVPTLGDAGVVDTITVIGIDVTREVDLRRQAEHSDRLKDEFLLTLSHELRTPLTSIVGWTAMLKDQRLDPQMQQKALDTIERAAADQARLVDDLLDVSRLRTGKLELVQEPLNVATIVERALQTLRPNAADRQIRIDVAIDPDITVNGDARLLHQVLSNVLSNALKFTAERGTIGIKLAHVGSSAVISIADDGAGIPREFLPHVFDRFRQADGSITRRHGGLGIGLSLAKQIVDLHGGSIAAASDGPGRGATFTIQLPLRPPPAKPAPVQSSGLDTSLAGIKVMVVEDNDDARDMVAAILEVQGAEVETAACAKDALLLLDRWRPDVLLSDIGLPDCDGYALLRDIHARVPGLPAAAVTAYTSGEDAQRATDAGFVLHLGKPVTAQKLANAVKQLAATR